MTDKEKIEKAIKIAWQYAQYDGSHHKMWVIDQMVRVLLGETEYKNFIDDFVIALVLHVSKSVDISNKADLVYAYNIAKNINRLFDINSFATNFDKEKDKYLEEALDAFVELHTNDEANVG